MGLSPIDVDTLSIILLRLLPTDTGHRDPYAVGALVCCPHHSYDDRNIHVSVSLRVGLSSLGDEAAGEPLQGGISLHPKGDNHRDNERR